VPSLAPDPTDNTGSVSFWPSRRLLPSGRHLPELQIHLSIHGAIEVLINWMIGGLIIDWLMFSASYQSFVLSSNYVQMERPATEPCCCLVINYFALGNTFVHWLGIPWFYNSNVLQHDKQIRLQLKPNSITLSGRRQVRSWSQTCNELEFGLSSSSLAAN